MSRKLKVFNFSNAVERYISGVGTQELSEEHRVGQGRLKEAFIQCGVPVRNRSSAMKQRWRNSSIEERHHLVDAAHEAAKGRKRTPEESYKRARSMAVGKRNNGSFVGRFEEFFITELTSRGFDVISQEVVSSYNVDVGLFPVAVEIHVAANHPYTDKRLRKRTKKLLEAGRSVLYVWITNAHPPSMIAIDEIIGFRKFVKSDKSSLSKHRVIRGSGQDASRSLNYYHGSGIETPV